MRQVGKPDQVEALARLAELRRNIYDCFETWADSLFELTDALAGADRPLRSIGELSLEPVGSRGWGSFYQALNHGTLNEEMALDLLLGQLWPAQPGKPLMFAIDSSALPRPGTTVVPEVGMQYTARGQRHRDAPLGPLALQRPHVVDAAGHGERGERVRAGGPGVSPKRWQTSSMAARGSLWSSGTSLSRSW